MNRFSSGQSISRVRVVAKSHHSKPTRHHNNYNNKINHNFNSLVIFLPLGCVPVPPAADPPPRARANSSSLIRLVNLDISIKRRFVLDRVIKLQQHHSGFLDGTSDCLAQEQPSVRQARGGHPLAPAGRCPVLFPKRVHNRAGRARIWQCTHTGIQPAQRHSDSSALDRLYPNSAPQFAPPAGHLPHPRPSQPRAPTFPA